MTVKRSQTSTEIDHAGSNCAKLSQDCSANPKPHVSMSRLSWESGHQSLWGKEPRLLHRLQEILEPYLAHRTDYEDDSAKFFSFEEISSLDEMRRAEP